MVGGREEAGMKTRDQRHHLPLNYWRRCAFSPLPSPAAQRLIWTFSVVTQCSHSAGVTFAFCGMDDKPRGGAGGVAFAGADHIR